MSEIYMIGQVTIAPGKVDEAKEILRELVTETNKEPGVLHYTLFEEEAKPGYFHMFEVYKDQAALDAHRSTAHFQAALPKLGPLLAGTPSIEKAKVVAGGG